MNSSACSPAMPEGSTSRSRSARILTVSRWLGFSSDRIASICYGVQTAALCIRDAWEYDGVISSRAAISAI